MKANIVPGLILQAFALSILVGYFRLEAVASFFNHIGALKLRHGYLYSALSTAFFGGILPYVVLLCSGKIPASRRVQDLSFYVCFWLWKGVEVDAMYRGQSALFGDELSPGVVVGKTIVDQFVYNLFWGAPTQTAFFLWKDCDYSFARFVARLGEQSFLQRSAVVLLSTWVVWVPAVSIVYCLPAALQIPLSNFVLCFWCLLLSYVSRTDELAQRADARP